MSLLHLKMRSGNAALLRAGGLHMVDMNAYFFLKIIYLFDRIAS